MMLLNGIVLPGVLLHLLQKPLLKQLKSDGLNYVKTVGQKTADRDAVFMVFV